MSEIRLCGSSHLEQHTDCCNVPFKYGGNYGQYYRKCPKCGTGDIWHDVATHFVYYPSEYEKYLEDKISDLERRINILEFENF